MSPGVGAEEVLALDGDRYVAEDSLNNVALKVVLPLLIGYRALVCAAVVGIEDGGFGGSECDCGESTGCEKVEDSFQMISSLQVLTG